MKKYVVIVFTNTKIKLVLEVETDELVNQTWMNDYAKNKLAENGPGLIMKGVIWGLKKE